MLEDHTAQAARLNALEAEHCSTSTQLSSQAQQIAALQADKETLQQRVEDLAVRAAVNSKASNCKCPCRCGCRSVAEEEKENHDHVELGLLMSDYKHVKEQLERESKRRAALQTELECSDERFVQSRSFKHLVSECHSIYENMKKYKRLHKESQRAREELEAAKTSEIQTILRREQEKHTQLKQKLEDAQQKLAQLQLTHDQQQEELVLIKENSSNSNNTSHFTNLIAVYEKDLAKKTEDHQKLLEAHKLLETQLSTHTQPTTGDSAIQEELERVRKQLEVEKETSDALLNEVEVTGQAYESMREKNRDLTLQLNKHENMYTQIMGERVQESTWKTLHEKEKATMQESIDTKEALVTSLTAANQALQGEVAAKEGLVKDLERTLAALEEKTEAVLKEHSRDMRKAKEVSELRERYAQRFADAEKVHVKLTREITQLETKQVQLEDRIKELTNQLSDAHSLDNLKSTDERLNDEIARYRVRLMQIVIRCVICTLRFKEVVIAKCYHTFCKQCIADNLDQRKRKCPQCQTKFGADDVKPFRWV